MLELRPNCEWCGKSLSPNADDARICTYECTFCADCVERVLFNVCPNCGGGFERRPIRPLTEWRPGVSQGKQPAATQRKELKWPRDEVVEFVKRLRNIEPRNR